jgi:transcription antitermination factor NusG
MPSLPKEAELHPDSIFESAEPWRIAHVRSRQEKVLARQLLQNGIPFYLPQTEGRGRRASYVPLFPGYVFFRGGAAARQVALRTNVVANMIEVDDQELLGAQLEQIRRLQLAGASLAPADELEAGDAVRITEGAFAGYEGTVVRSGRGERLVVSVSLLRKSVVVEFPRRRLRRRP